MFEKQEVVMKKIIYTLFVCMPLMFLLNVCQENPGTVSGPDQDYLARIGVSGTGINIVLNQPVSDQILSVLSTFGEILNIFPEINAVRIDADAGQLPAIIGLPFVYRANGDMERHGRPVNIIDVSDFSKGLSTWNLDAVNVCEFGEDNRVVVPDGSGVYMGILDTGLLNTWREYFPADRIAAEYAKCYSGGAGEKVQGGEQPNKWEHDTDAHGTHVTSTVIGYSYNGTSINGVAPGVTVIPVKVLNQTGMGWSSVIAKGILYIASLKETGGPLQDFPVVINMSLGGPVLDAVEQAAIDYAISKGVIIVASAGNLGEAGMGYPGGYEPVISVAAAGWVKEWTPDGDRTWWRELDVAESYDCNDYYITDFSSRELAGQDLDVCAPGSWVVGPYQIQMGVLSYYYLGGTSQASPHVAGLVALMAQQYPDLTAAQAEAILESTAMPLPAGCRTILNPDGSTLEQCWEANATGAGLINAQKALASLP